MLLGFCCPHPHLSSKARNQSPITSANEAGGHGRRESRLVEDTGDTIGQAGCLAQNGASDDPHSSLLCPSLSWGPLSSCPLDLSLNSHFSSEYYSKRQIVSISVFLRWVPQVPLLSVPLQFHIQVACLWAQRSREHIAKERDHVLRGNDTGFRADGLWWMETDEWWMVF